MRRGLRLYAVLVVGLVLCGCPHSGVGDACSATSPCPPPLTCDATLPGGSCSLACTTLGNTDQCLGTPNLSDAQCAVFDGGLACARGCGSLAPCRTGYTCRPLDGGAGPVASGVCLAP